MRHRTRHRGYHRFQQAEATLPMKCIPSIFPNQVRFDVKHFLWQIMQPSHLLATRQALYRVFVFPFQAHNSSIPLALRPRASQRLQCFHQRRPYAKYRPPVQRTQAYDEEIQSQFVHIVDSSGKLGPAITRFDALHSFDRQTHHLVQVAPLLESDPATGEPTPPVCKVISKEELRAIERSKSKAKTKKSPDQLTKQLEINWAIDQHDLQHRLKRFAEFLEQGRRVEILLARKKSGRQATTDEALHLLEILRGTCEDVGGKEWKMMEGKVGFMAKLYFEGSKDKKQQS